MNTATWTDDELVRYAWLRANEWTSFPAYVFMGISQLLLLITGALPILVVLVVASIIWSLFCESWVSLKLSEVGFVLNKLKWITSPLVAFIALSHHRGWGVAVLALLWPIVTMLVGMFHKPVRIGVVQDKILMKMGCRPLNDPSLESSAKTRQH